MVFATMTAADDPAFAIRIDPATTFVRITMRQFWTTADRVRFEARLRSMLTSHARAGFPIGRQVTLFDLRDFPPQGGDVLEGLARMAADPAIGSRRIAVLATSTLLKMQARRTAPGYALFEDEDEAMAWLGQEDGDQASARA